MAIYHMNVQTLSRSKGHNAVAAIAYRRGVKLKDESTQQTFDYSKKQEVIFSEIVIPENAPAWMLEIAELQKVDPNHAAELLWTSVEQKENRKDSQLAREIKMALPIELTEDQSIALTQEYVKRFCKLGMVVDFSIHWDQGNPHVHILLSMRILKQDGWGEKERGWNSKEFTLMAREHLAEVINKHLTLWGFEGTVSHLSYVEQGIDQEPTIHIGNQKNRSAQQARIRNQGVRLRNLQKIIDNPEILLESLAKRKSSFSVMDIAKTLGTQLTPANQANIQPDPEPPRKRRMSASFSNLMATVAPKFFQANIAGEPAISNQAKIDEILMPTIEVAPDATVDEVIAKVLAEVTRNEAVFTEQHLSRILSRYVENPEQVALALLQIKSSAELLAIGPGEDGRERFTTCEMFEIENELQELAEQLAHKTTHQVGGRLINKTIREFNLKDDQARAIRYLLKGSDLSIMVGRAGTGKSYSLKAARIAWEACDYRVLGVALAGIAAQGLQQDAGISSRTIESFCLALKQESLKLCSQDIIVMDEAGMTDSISMSKVMTAVKQAGAKLVLVGDHAQLQPVGPGAIFRALLERVGFAELTNIRRQREAWQREATAHFAAGNTEKALEYYERHGCIHLERTAASAASLLIQDWGSAIREYALERSLILAYENVDVNHLNLQARQLLISAGKLPQGHLVKNHQGMLEVAVGERILFLENHWRYHIKNGHRATVTHIELGPQQQVKALHLEVDGKDKKSIIIDPEKYKAFTHGYACTVHRAQGITVENTFVYVSGRWNKNLSYVAMSRHQGKADIYAHQEAFQTIHELKKGLSKGALKDSVLDYPMGFAERRGVSIEGSRTSSLKQHLARKLQWIAQSLKSNFEQTFFPKEYWERKAKEAIKQQDLLETIERREDAKLVAAYIDANRAVGIAWQALNEKQLTLGITKDTPFMEREARFVSDGSLGKLREACIKRDALASEIYSEHGRYTKALALYDISLEKLDKQSKAHLNRDRIAEYLKEVKSGRVVHRDKLAFQIQAEFKQHYGALRNAEVSLVDLRKQAASHTRRKLFKDYSEREKENFRKVESYVKLCQKTGSLGQQIIRQEKSLKDSSLIEVNDLTPYQLARLQVLSKMGTPLLRRLLMEAKLLNQQRNHLAAEMVANIEDYKPGLDFYEFGQLKNKAKNPSDFDLKSEQWAKERLEKLYHQAETHQKATEKQQTIKKYVELLKQQDESRYTIAAEIITQKKSYYGIIFESASNPMELLRDLHREAKKSQRHDLVQGLAAEERAAFLKVEQYLEQKNIVGKIWGERNAALDRNHPVIKEIFLKENVLKDELAAGILANPERYHSVLKFFNIKLESLSQSAGFYDIRTNLADFKKRVGDLTTRVALAKKIMNSRVAYLIAKEDGTIKIEQLKRYADYAMKLERIAALTSTERLQYEAILKYKRSRREAGKIWAEIFTLKKQGLEVSEQLFKRGLSLNKLRNELAYHIKNQRDKVDDFLYSAQVVTRDIDKHSVAHEKQLIFIKAQALYKKSADVVKGLRKTLTNNILVIEKKPYWDLDEVHLALEARASDFVNSILGSQNQKLSNGNTYRYGKKGSLVVTIRGEKSGLWYNFETGEKGNLIALIQYQFGYDFKQAVQYAAEWAGIAPETKLSRTIKQNYKKAEIKYSSKEFTQEQLDKIAYAKDIVANSVSVSGTLAEKYLQAHRKITGPILDQTFKFNAAVWEPETQQNQAALVVIARNENHEVQAVQCIYLDKNTGHKLNIAVAKRTIGPLLGASVLVQQGNSSNQFAVAEGPETALSVGQGNPALSVWAVLSASNFGKVAVPTGSNKVLICADNDGIEAASNKSVVNAAQILSERGLNVWCVKPEAHKDFNDVLKDKGVEAVQEALEQKILLKSGFSIEDLIQNKQDISDNSKLIVDFVEKYQEYEALQNIKTLPEILKKLSLLEDIGKLAVIFKNNPEFSESIVRHGLMKNVNSSRTEYTKYVAEQKEVERLTQELKVKDAIKEYSESINKISKLSPVWVAKIESEKQHWTAMNTKIKQLAYIIDKTPRLQYAAKKTNLYESLKQNASNWQRLVKEKLSLEIVLGIGR